MFVCISNWNFVTYIFVTPLKFIFVQEQMCIVTGFDNVYHCTTIDYNSVCYCVIKSYWVFFLLCRHWLWTFISLCIHWLWKCIWLRQLLHCLFTGCGNVCNWLRQLLHCVVIGCDSECQYVVNGCDHVFHCGVIGCDSWCHCVMMYLKKYIFMDIYLLLTDFEIFQWLVALMFSATLKISYITSCGNRGPSGSMS